MADRYKDRRFPAVDNYDRGGDHNDAPKAESDPLAELARLIGQNDPFAGLGGRANQSVPPRSRDREPPFRRPEPVPEPEFEADEPPPPPSWMQRASAKELPVQNLDDVHLDRVQRDDVHRDEVHRDRDDFDSVHRDSVHPVQRYASHAPEPDYHQEPSYEHAPTQHEPAADPERYDGALYGELPAIPGGLPPQSGYEDPYTYQEDDYDAASEEQEHKPRRGGMITVVVVLALAVVGTGAAFAYRTFVGPSRSGEPPIIRADAGPNKMIPPSQSGDSSGKLIQDRMTGGGTEKLVSREEQPVDIPDGKTAPRVVFPSLNQNANPPSSASVAPGNRGLANTGPNTGNGTMSGDEPRKIHTFSVRGDQPDPAAAPAGAAKPATGRAAAQTATRNTANANAAVPANAPLSLAPQGGAPQATAPSAGTRVASAPSLNTPMSVTSNSNGASSNVGSGSYVQLSSQPSEADAQASFRALQGKYASVLGSRSLVIKRVDLGEKGIKFRALVGPFASADEAAQLCSSLKSAGGQCFPAKY
jgi:SPOR domain